MSKPNRKERKTQNQLETLGLNLNQLTTEQLREANANNIQTINQQLAGSQLMSFGSLLAGDIQTSNMISGMRAIIEQNWILIRQQEETNRLLYGILNKQN